MILKEIVGWDLWTSSILLITATGIYVVLGGLKAVVYTENVQTIILLIGGCIVTGYCLTNVGGLSAIYNKVQTSSVIQSKIFFFFFFLFLFCSVLFFFCFLSLKNKNGRFFYISVCEFPHLRHETHAYKW